MSGLKISVEVEPSTPDYFKDGKPYHWQVLTFGIGYIGVWMPLSSGRSETSDKAWEDAKARVEELKAAMKDAKS